MTAPAERARERERVRKNSTEMKIHFDLIVSYYSLVRRLRIIYSLISEGLLILGANSTFNVSATYRAVNKR